MMEDGEKMEGSGVVVWAATAWLEPPLDAG